MIGLALFINSNLELQSSLMLVLIRGGLGTRTVLLEALAGPFSITAQSRLVVIVMPGKSCVISLIFIDLLILICFQRNFFPHCLLLDVITILAKQ